MTGSSISRELLDSAARLRLVCLPYAGGGSAIYHQWRMYVPRSIDLLPVCLAGREGRIQEPLPADLRAAARAIADDLEDALDRPWVMLGHSLGAWIGFELLRELRRRGLHAPSLVIVAASPAPHLVRSEPSLHTLPDDDFIAAVDKRFASIPPAFFENAELRDTLLPVLRSDMRMVETYTYVEAPPLETEILAVGGVDDPSVSVAQLNEWRRQTTGPFSSRLLPGGHFFLFDRGNKRAEPNTASHVPAKRMSPALKLIVSRLEQLTKAENH